jgi:hypothetical protein
VIPWRIDGRCHSCDSLPGVVSTPVSSSVTQVHLPGDDAHGKGTDDNQVP